MRKILMNQKGEFKNQGKTDYVRSTAVKMMASVIKREDKYKEGSEVVISNKALHRTSQ
jgi:hypothetical protein